MPRISLSFEQLIAEADQQTMRGWDFSSLDGRWQEYAPAWNYRQAVCRRLPAIHALLDMGTGGGELLASLTPLPPDTVATEGYPPNVAIARRNLEPRGIAVMEVCSDEQLPFPDARFDLVINRHESFSAPEIHRILRSGGTFITQQVGGQDNIELNRCLQDEVTVPYGHWNRTYAVDLLAQAGFEIIESQEEFPLTHFYDVGAIVYLLKATPWQIAGFTVARYAGRLKSLHDLIQKKGYFESLSHRFYIEARKP